MIRVLMVIVSLVVPLASDAGDYDISVTRKGSNLYKVDNKDIYIFTKYCYQYVYFSEAILRMSGTRGRIIFVDADVSCDVKSVYGPASLTPGKYSVTVSHLDEDWYEVSGTETLIRTSLCISLALSDEAILIMSSATCGKLVFSDGKSCIVEGVYVPVRL
jgi:hypothetical protein